MALSLIGRLSSPALKGQFFKSIKNELLKQHSAVCFVGQSYHSRLALGEIPSKKKCISFKSNVEPALPVNIVKRFSTSPSLLAEHRSHDHSKIWTFERLLSVSLLPLIPAALLSPCQQLDTAMALVIVLHTHFGLEAIVVDYIRPILFGQLAPKIGLCLLYLFSIVTLAGLLNLIYNDTGLANTVLNVWKK